MSATIELRQVPSRPALVVHARFPLGVIGAALGKSFGDVQRWAAAHGVAIRGPAVARYTTMTAEACEVDAGFIVGTPVDAGDGLVGAVDLGGCTAAFVTHIGPYETLAETYAAIERWMRETGYVSAGPMWEEYFSPPATPAHETRTDVYWPVRKG